MIDNDALKKISDKKGIDKYSVLRELVQISFLNELYKLTKSEKVFFKGGTAIRLLFGSNRYSEDLDFTSNLDEVEIDEIIKGTIKNIDKVFSGIVVKNVETIAGFSKKLFLQTDFAHQPLTIKLDFSQRESVLEPKQSIISTDLPIIPSSLITHISREEILAEKYRAIMNREKGRDLFDFLFLLNRKTPLVINLIKEKLKFYKEKYEPDKFIKKIKNWNEAELDGDIRKFLPVKDRAVITKIKPLLVEAFENQLVSVKI